MQVFAYKLDISPYILIEGQSFLIYSDVTSSNKIVCMLVDHFTSELWPANF